MTITMNKEDNKLVISLDGRLDTTTAPELDKAIEENLGDEKELELNMEKVAYVSSAGLRVILYAYKKLLGKGGELKVTKVSDEVLEVFKVTGFTDFIQIC